MKIKIKIVGGGGEILDTSEFLPLGSCDLEMYSVFGFWKTKKNDFIVSFVWSTLVHVYKTHFSCKWSHWHPSFVVNLSSVAFDLHYYYHVNVTIWFHANDWWVSMLFNFNRKLLNILLFFYFFLEKKNMNTAWVMNWLEIEVSGHTHKDHNQTLTSK